MPRRINGVQGGFYRQHYNALARRQVFNCSKVSNQHYFQIQGLNGQMSGRTKGGQSCVVKDKEASSDVP